MIFQSLLLSNTGVWGAMAKLSRWLSVQLSPFLQNNQSHRGGPVLMIMFNLPSGFFYKEYELMDWGIKFSVSFGDDI